MTISEKLRNRILTYQRNEITEYHIYQRLSKQVGSPENREILHEIAADELRHYNEWKEYTQKEVKPDRFKIWFYLVLARLFGFTFSLKLMESGEESAQENYAGLQDQIPEAKAMARDENHHEEVLLQNLDEERLRYTSSIVLGLNDALVELTGALAGLTLALQNTQLIALSGLITGLAASLSMAASEYLSTKSEEDTTKHPLRASIYTGSAYVSTVVILIAPYLLLDNYYICLALTLLAAVAIIALFNYYVSVAMDKSFKARFLEMAGLSLGVAALSFVIGFVVRKVLGVEV